MYNIKFLFFSNCINGYFANYWNIGSNFIIIAIITKQPPIAIAGLPASAAIIVV